MGDPRLGHVAYFTKPAGRPTHFEALFFEEHYSTISDHALPPPAQRLLFSGDFTSYRYDGDLKGWHPNTGGQPWVSLRDAMRVSKDQPDSAVHLFAGATPDQLTTWVEEWGGVVYVPRSAASPDIVLSVPGIGPQTQIVPAVRVPAPLDAPWRPLALGALIDLLAREDPKDKVYFDFGDFIPRKLDSYRGFYDQLALGYDDDHQAQMTVGELLGEMRQAVGRIYTGYKGGDYMMSRETPVWAANYGRAPSTGIVGVRRDTWVILETVYIGV